MQPIRFTPDVEQVDPDEQRLTREIVEQMNATARNAFERHRHAHRDAHAKSHAILKGSMTVHDGLSAELAQGIFASPKTYEVVARLSSAPGDIHSDEVPAPRGFAIKVIGVPGDRLSPDIGGENQDFLMVNFPVLAFGTIPKYKQMLGLLEKNAHAPDFFQRLVAGVARGAKDALEAVGKVPSATLEGLARDNNHPLGETYHTQAAVRFGDHVAKLSLAPKSQSVRDLTGRDLEDVQYSTMRDVIGDFFRANGTEYELRAQLCTDLETMPVEDAAVLWEVEKSPHRAIATLRFDSQDPYSPPRQVFGDDVLSFNPWNGVEAHRPLGGIMRIRRAAYERSSTYRHAQNDRPRTEPQALSDIPD